MVTQAIWSWRRLNMHLFSAKTKPPIGCDSDLTFDNDSVPRIMPRPATRIVAIVVDGDIDELLDRSRTRVEGFVAPEKRFGRTRVKSITMVLVMSIVIKLLL